MLAQTVAPYKEIGSLQPLKTLFDLTTLLLDYNPDISFQFKSSESPVETYLEATYTHITPGYSVRVPLRAMQLADPRVDPLKAFAHRADYLIGLEMDRRDKESL